MQDTENPYDDLILNYDLLLETSQMHPKERQYPVCYTTLFFNRGRVPASLKGWEMAQIDAFWLLHILHCGSCEVHAAHRLFYHGFICKEEEDPDWCAEATISLSDKGLKCVFQSLEDIRIREKVLPFIKSFAQLENLHTEPKLDIFKEQETRRNNYRRTRAVIVRESERTLQNINETSSPKSHLYTKVCRVEK